MPNVIISQAAAAVLFPSEDPIGKQVRPAANANQWYTVIGVVEDVLVDDLRRTIARPDGLPAGGVRIAGVRHEVGRVPIGSNRKFAPSSARSFPRHRCTASSR